MSEQACFYTFIVCVLVAQIAFAGRALINMVRHASRFKL